MTCRITLIRHFSTAAALLLLILGMAFTQGVALGAAKKGKGNSSVPTKRKVGTFVGATRPLGSGTVRSWVTLNEEGKPAAVGLTFSESALRSAPTELPSGREGTELVLELPKEAGATAFNHILFNWNPNGHEPPGTYDIAHFDIHFYLISPEEREAITAQGDDLAKCYKAPPAEYVPAGYILPQGTAVPRMGAHWLNPQARELQGQKFTNTFLFGNYDGRIIFYEPMITKSVFETKVDITEYIKLPARVQKPGYYPTKYSVRYDAAKKEYTVALEGMTLR